MKRLVKYFLGGLLLLQLPFLYAVCRTWEVERYLERLPRTGPPRAPFQDLRGTIHVHSSAGGHSLGTYEEILEAAKTAGYDYIFITEHTGAEDTSGLPAASTDPIVIPGVEETLPDGSRVLRDRGSTTIILTEFEDGALPDYVNALEVYNMHENAESQNDLIQWINFVYHEFFFPELFYFQIWEMNQKRLRFWDRVLSERKLAGSAGNDAHQNIGIRLQTTSGRVLFSWMLDPYLRSFQFLTNHLLLPPDVAVGEDSILEALSRGSFYIAFEKIADPTGFSFHADSVDGIMPMGSEVPAGSHLIFQSPVPARFRVLKSGETYRVLHGTRFSLPVEETGAYRLEVSPLRAPRLLQGKPWIISNPIYVR